MSKLQANPGEITWHEGNVWVPDANTIQETTTQNDEHPLVSGLNLMAKVGLQIGKATEQVAAATEKVGQMARAIERNTPVSFTKVVSQRATASTTSLIFDFGQPDSGTFWEIASWALGGRDVTSGDVNLGGGVGLYVSALPTIAGAGVGNMVDIVTADRATTLPYVAHYSSSTLTVEESENLFAIWWNPTTTLSPTHVMNVQMRVYNVIASQGQVAYTA